MAKFRIGDIANGVETSEEIIEVKDELHALRILVSQANLYCEEVTPSRYKKSNIIKKIADLMVSNNITLQDIVSEYHKVNIIRLPFLSSWAKWPIW